MSKGMNIDEFRQVFETDSQKKVTLLEEKIKKQEELIATLFRENGNLKGDLAARKQTNVYLFNRCKALTAGSMCIFCGLMNECLASQATCDNNTKGDKK